MTSIRARLLLALLVLVATASLVAVALTYQRTLAETSALFDYQLRQMALSLRNQVSIAPRIELPPQPGDSDFIIQIFDPFGTSVYRSRPGLPIIQRAIVGYENLRLDGQVWRVYGLQTNDGLIEIAQPLRVREALARGAALRIGIPLLLLIPVLFVAIVWIVGGSLRPLQRAAAEVQQRDQHSLKPLTDSALPDEIRPLISELNRLLSRLDAAFAAQRAFVADAAHELRSPLTAVRLQLQLLDRAPDEPSRLDARAKLGAAVERAQHLIEQLLTLARNEPRGVSEEAKLLPLEAPVSNAIADCHALAVTRGIDLSLQAEPNVCVRGQAEAVRMLARNLVDNAVRYTPPGGRVQVRIREQPHGPLLEVSDTGPGIPAEDRERAFDRFYRRENSLEGGSGLGLAIVKAIAERHGARVKLDEAPGGGLKVGVEFPRANGMCA
jgi:two-component system OmpR family sensor kinase/two-component system sensor histidine kinase QseC